MRASGQDGRGKRGLQGGVWISRRGARAVAGRGAGHPQGGRTRVRPAEPRLVHGQRIVLGGAAPRRLHSLGRRHRRGPAACGLPHVLRGSAGAAVRRLRAVHPCRNRELPALVGEGVPEGHALHEPTDGRCGVRAGHLRGRVRLLAAGLAPAHGEEADEDGCPVAAPVVPAVLRPSQTARRPAAASRLPAGMPDGPWGGACAALARVHRAALRAQLLDGRRGRPLVRPVLPGLWHVRDGDAVPARRRGVRGRASSRAA